MSRKLLFFGVMFLLLAGFLVTPFSVLAEGDPPPNPEPVHAPWITGVNPFVSTSDIQAENLDASGLVESWEGIDISLMTGSPDYLELEPQADPADAGNAFFAAVKSLLKVMPDGASRRLVEEMLLDPSQYNHLYKTLIAL